ncbi:uncharacterized protein LOC114075958 [Solanum pennellii]|uniref:Uncharacterized protein LOC114075958 n=1 Tax=Solanum pennellii TaxID=28526 RepID=A0ABM1V2H5_SOLPN|nr:uncharacterized protein LOC114075958 [Solanum pennellii]
MLLVQSTFFVLLCFGRSVQRSPSVNTTTTNQHSKKKTDTSLEQLKEGKTETKDLEEHCNRIAVVDPSVTKRTITIRHDHEKKASTAKQATDDKLKGVCDEEDDTCDYSPRHNHSFLKYIL